MTKDRPVELQTGWFNSQKQLHYKQRLTLDEMLTCYNYAVMMRQRGLTLSDIGNYCGVSKEAVRMWFDRGLPEHHLMLLDEAISNLRPVKPPSEVDKRVWDEVMHVGWKASLDEVTISEGHAGGLHETHETEAEIARRARLPELAQKYRESITHCKRGHEFTPENTRLRGPNRTWRQCRTCDREREARRGQTYKSTPQQQGLPADSNRKPSKAAAKTSKRAGG